KGKKHPRIVYLTPQARKITTGLCEKFPKGPLFRNHTGKPLIQQTISSAFRRLRIKVGMNAIERSGTTLKACLEQDMKECTGDCRPLDELSATQRRMLEQQTAIRRSPDYCLYALRHSFATNALRAGLDGLTVAILLGHRDVSMLARVYQHLSHEPEHLLRQVQRTLPIETASEAA
ncbi:MAG: tyrosine-type recombinase/integrase, partial [Planctomycetaceae bacterium]|nr:tyrosine-type recombinase/integrase [Planctomycetaceae bacterium]